MHGESKTGLSTYYIKLRHVKTVFGTMLGRVGEIELNDSFSTSIICSRKKLKKECKIHYEFLTW